MLYFSQRQIKVWCKKFKSHYLKWSYVPFWFWSNDPDQVISATAYTFSLKEEDEYSNEVNKITDETTQDNLNIIIIFHERQLSEYNSNNSILISMTMKYLLRLSWLSDWYEWFQVSYVIDHLHLVQEGKIKPSYFLCGYCSTIFTKKYCSIEMLE